MKITILKARDAAAKLPPPNKLKSYRPEAEEDEDDAEDTDAARLSALEDYSKALKAGDIATADEHFREYLGFCRDAEEE